MKRNIAKETVFDYIKKTENRFYCFWHLHDQINEEDCPLGACEFSSIYLDWIPDFLTRMTLNAPSGNVGIYAVVDGHLYRIYNGPLNKEVIVMLENESEKYYVENNFKWAKLGQIRFEIKEIDPEGKVRVLRLFGSFEEAKTALIEIADNEGLSCCCNYTIEEEGGEILYKISGPEP